MFGARLRKANELALRRWREAVRAPGFPQFDPVAVVCTLGGRAGRVVIVSPRRIPPVGRFRERGPFVQPHQCRRCNWRTHTKSRKGVIAHWDRMHYQLDDLLAAGAYDVLVANDEEDCATDDHAGKTPSRV